MPVPRLNLRQTRRRRGRAHTPRRGRSTPFPGRSPHTGRTPYVNSPSENSPANLPLWKAPTTPKPFVKDAYIAFGFDKIADGQYFLNCDKIVSANNGVIVTPLTLTPVLPETPRSPFGP